MVKKIIISHFNNIAAILYGNKTQEIIVINQQYQINDIYIGVVQKIFSSINAAFIKLGKYGKSGFIHINDIKPLKKRRNGHNISEILAINQMVLVQVIKEPTLHKGPRLTTNVNLIGKYLILMPFCNTINISQKIYDENERIYLHSLAILIKPMAMGLVIKSSAQGIKEQELSQDLQELKKQWDFIEKIASITKLPKLIYKDEDIIKKVIRDNYNKNIKKIIIDSKHGINQLYYHLEKYSVNYSNINKKLQLYKKPACILHKFQIRESIIKALKPKVQLESGGHLIIETNEAFTVIDVNSGSFNKPNNSKDAILKTNCYAALEIAYQLKIRNINGVIVIDFIDMKSQKDQLQLLEYFNQLLKLDHAKPQIVQLSELGLVELTRRRRGQSLHEAFHCNTNNKTYNQIFLRQSLQNRKYNDQAKNDNIHKNINTLFFYKKFRKKIKLTIKKFQSKDNYQCLHFIYFDSLNTIKLFKPKANFLVPLYVYSYLIRKK
uniref:Ribonuclease E n=1 Tax=Gastroclonium compressum TaxID=1852973 RepID=A0A173FZT0_GASCM|nr:ribonuclease E [Coeloseira compressa]ANH09529.1 ribonuclease E [Coeloseira compressa]